MPAGTPRQLSSIVTLPRKFVYSVLSVAVFFSVPWIFRAPGMPAFVPWLFLGALTFNALAAWKIEVPLKRVRLDDTNLYISNFVVETVEPLTNVAEVSLRAWMSPHVVTVRFHTATRFGPKITFIPKSHLSLRDPEYDDLCRAVARGASTTT